MYKNGYPLKSLLCLLLISLFVSCSGPKRHYQRTASNHTNVKKSSSHNYHKKRSTKKIAEASAPESSVAMSQTRNAVVHTAKKFIGTPYKFGGKKPQGGFDCSGFISYVFNQNGMPITGASHSQAKMGKKKSQKDAQPGDLIFFGKNQKISHVAIVTRNTGRNIEVIHSTSSRGVVIDNINDSDYWTSRYLFTTEVIR